MNRRRIAALVGVVPALVLGGCGTAASPSPPTGVDGLTVPTPSADPADFVAGVDNPWFPLAVGATWTYVVPGHDGGSGGVRMSVTTGPDVGGVATTAVRTVSRLSGPLGRSDVVDLYAQDRAGNVWWFGHQILSSADSRDVSWRAGDGAAEAGLAVPASPRMGDGFRSALQPRLVDERDEVVSTVAEVDVPFGHFPATLAIDSRDALHDRTVRRFYARGVGLVEQQSLIGLGNTQIELATHTP